METMSLCEGFLLAKYIWYCFIYRAKSNLSVISSVFRRNCSGKIPVWSWIVCSATISQLWSLERNNGGDRIWHQQIFLHCRNCIWDSWQYFDYRVHILRQKNVLKNNYYFLVLQLAICDLGALIIYLLHVIFYNWLEEPLNKFNKFYCLGYNVSYIFQVAGIGMMLVISELRYRALCIP